MSEELLDAENWKNEARAVINDIRDHVKAAEVSQNIASSDQRVFLNFTTFEGEHCCVELSASGFRIVGRAHDTSNLQDGQYFETPYGLLSQISADFHKSFGNALMSKLSTLNNLGSK